MSENNIQCKKNIYHIRVRGCLDDKWADWFGGFAMASCGDDQTLLSGAVADQAALHGVLARIQDLGLHLLLVVQTNCPCTSKNCDRRAQCQECAANYQDKRQLPYCFRAGTKWNKQCANIQK